MTPQTSLSTLPARVRAAWRAHLAAAGQWPGQRARLLRQQAEVLPRFAAAYAQLQALPRPQRRRLFRRLKQSLASLALLLALGQGLALAATIPVDGTTCTLVDAITAANTDATVAGSQCPAGSGADTIVLPANSTITLTSVATGGSGLPQITSAITIEGNGSTIRRDSSAPAFRIFDVIHGNLTLNNTTVSGGGGSGAFVGGGIKSSSGTVVTLTNSTISGNTALAGGGLFNDGTLTVTNSTVSGNSAPYHGTFFNIVGRGGGIFHHSGTLTVTNSTVSGNTASFLGGGICNSEYYTVATATLTSSTVSGNTAGSGGGGIENYNRAATVTLARSLVSGNTAPFGPEIDNSAGYINANNFNLIGHDGNAGTYDNYNRFSPSGSDIVPSQALSAILAVDASGKPLLANNGGPTQTLALVPGSPAIDAIPSTDPDCAGTDQRGVLLPQDGNGDGLARCDIGAFELVPPFAFRGFFAPVDNPPTLNTVKAGSRIPVKFSLGGNQGVSLFFTAGSPTSVPIACDPTAPQDAVEPTATAGNSSLAYDATTQTYTYVWKTDKSWAGTCRQFLMQLIDGSLHSALFKFTK